MRQKNDIVYDPDGNCYIEIISPKYGLFLVQIDEADIPLLSPYRWSMMRDKRRRKDAQFVPHGSVDGKMKLMYHLLIQLPPGMVTDHVDGDPTNNTRANLRAVTQQQNMWNLVGAKGYHYNMQRNKYQAYIRVNKVMQSLGYFDTAEQAHAAYLAAKSQLHVVGS
jgi:hypothetical protein